MRHARPTAALSLALAAPASAHFGMIIPDRAMLAQEDGREIALKVGFGHPFAPSGMELARPKAFGVTTPEGATDLIAGARARRLPRRAGLRRDRAVERPGVQVFHLEPEPYWEPAEDMFIVHYTKTYVPAFGDDTGWDAELGLPTEIVPLTRPFGLWAGNLFQGVVKRDGAPVPHAEVEVEFYDEAGAVAAPLRADGARRRSAPTPTGVFSYAAPRARLVGLRGAERGRLPARARRRKPRRSSSGR